jgi:hypothetical protein
MKSLKFILLGLIVTLFMTSCTENYSNGERIGLVTQFSKTGLMFKTHEGHLNLTQTGMNSSSAVPFDFSVDADNEDANIVAKLDSAATYGWKVKIVYHETFGKNWFSTRGETNHFVKSVDILDRNPVGSIFNGEKSNRKSGNCTCKTVGTTIDTIYVILDKTK